jgi:hypothetical protein
MPKEKKAASEKPERKGGMPPSFLMKRCQWLLTYPTARSSGGGGRKKLTAYNKFMQTEMARLKEDEPGMTHQAR